MGWRRYDMQSDTQREGGRKWSKGGVKRRPRVYVCISRVCVHSGEPNYTSFCTLVCICTIHMSSKYVCVCVFVCSCRWGAREWFLLGARHVREGRRLAPHGTVCYHSASLIPSPHVCNLTWCRTAGESAKEKKQKKLDLNAAKKTKTLLFPPIFCLIWFLPVLFLFAC